MPQRQNHVAIWIVALLSGGFITGLAYGLFAEFEHSPWFAEQLRRFLNDYEVVIFGFIGLGATVAIALPLYALGAFKEKVGAFGLPAHLSFDPHASTERRTTGAFVIAQDPWPAVEYWAAANGYYFKGGPNNDSRVYQKGTGFLVAPMMCAIHVDRATGWMTVQAWVRMNLFVRISSLFILPSEMHIRSGGFRAVLPRKLARTPVNALLYSLGQMPIP